MFNEYKHKPIQLIECFNPEIYRIKLFFFHSLPEYTRHLKLLRSQISHSFF